VDVGEHKPRFIASGLCAIYSIVDLVDRHVLLLVLCNLKQEAQSDHFPIAWDGPVLCAFNYTHDKVEFVVPSNTPPATTTTTTTTTSFVTIGERVVFGTLIGTPEPENKVAVKKMVEQLFPYLQTNVDHES
jgi:hypothetical protein